MPLAVEGGITGIRKACVATKEQSASTEDSLIVSRSCAISHELRCSASRGTQYPGLWSNITLYVHSLLIATDEPRSGQVRSTS